MIDPASNYPGPETTFWYHRGWIVHSGGTGFHIAITEMSRKTGKRWKKYPRPRYWTGLILGD